VLEVIQSADPPGERLRVLIDAWGAEIGEQRVTWAL
jgi:hypothetical protein